jgi:hypothetical protein
VVVVGVCLIAGQFNKKGPEKKTPIRGRKAALVLPISVTETRIATNFVAISPVFMTWLRAAGISHSLPSLW